MPAHPKPVPRTPSSDTYLSEDGQIGVISFAGHPLQLDAAGVVYWPEFDTLLFADLHFEKGSYFAQDGQFLPPYDTASTCSDMRAVLEKYNPQSVICLGDSFHDVAAEQRMSAEDMDCLSQLVRNVPQWIWITGNHDPVAPAQVGGDSAKAMPLGDIILLHEPMDLPAAQICGHYHPKAQTAVGRRKLKGPCFAYTDQLMIMPSFGSYTGGLWTSHPEIERWLGKTPCRQLIYQQKLYDIGCL